MPGPPSKPHRQADPAAVHEISGQGGRKEWSFKPRAFNIVWGGDRRYWVVPEKDDGPAELVQVSWLQVTASTTDNLSPGKYKISFKVSMSQGAFGWKDCPVFILAKVGKSGGYMRKRIKLNSLEGNAADKITVPDDDGLTVEVPAKANANRADSKLYFGLYEVWTGRWKGGLRIHEALVRKEV